MASEMRRAAQALVERRVHSFRSDLSISESVDRLVSAGRDGKLGAFDVEATEHQIVLRLRKSGDDCFIGHWREGPILEGEFLPPRRTQRDIKALAAALTLMLGACVWAIASGQDVETRASLGVFAVLSILAFPYIILGLSSQRAGREAALARAVQKTLTR